MSKREKNIWIQPPSLEFANEWKVFIYLGMVLREYLRKVQFNEVKTENVTEVLKNFHKLKKGTNLQLKESKKNSSSKIKSEIFENTNFQEDKEIISLLYLDNAFTFFNYKETPILARAIISILCWEYFETCIIRTFDEIQTLFKILNIPIEKYKEEGDKLLKYSNGKNYLKRRRNSLEFSLTKRGFKELLGVDIKEPRKDSSIFAKMLFDIFKKQQNEKRDLSLTFKEVKIDELVLDDETKQKIEFILKYSKKDNDSNFKLLLYGPPGTGKTYTAYAIACELKKPLIVFDLAKVMDMYVGETEKIISRYFEFAEKENGILLIDEADSYLMERRGTNRLWENNLVNHLLSLIENKKVNLIICTNLYEVIDRALLRRLDEVTEFKFPQEKERKRLWKIYLSKSEIFLEESDIEKLSKIELNGALIANVVKKATRMKTTYEKDIDINLLKNLAFEETKKIKISKGKIIGFGGLR